MRIVVLLNFENFFLLKSLVDLKKKTLPTRNVFTMNFISMMTHWHFFEIFLEKFSYVVKH